MPPVNSKMRAAASASAGGDCPKCGRFLASRHGYLTHVDKCTNRRCQYCKKRLASEKTLQAHIARFHPPGSEYLAYRCGICTLCFHTQRGVERHRETEHVMNTDFTLLKEAHGGQTKVFRAYLGEDVKDFDTASIHMHKLMLGLIEGCQVDSSYFKVTFALFADMYRVSDLDEVEKTDLVTFLASTFPVSRVRGAFDKDRVLEAIGEIESRIDEFTMCGSGWVLHRPVFLEAKVVECAPLAGSSSCLTHVVRWGRGRGLEVRGLNPSAKGDGMCFQYAVAAFFLCRQEGTSKPEDLRKEELEFFAYNSFLGGYDGCMEITRIKDFERAHSHLDLAINVVYKDEKADVIPCYASTNISARNQITLALFDQLEAGRDGEEGEPHYALVPDPGLLFARRNKKQEVTGDVPVAANLQPVDEEAVRARSRTYPNYICFHCFNTCNTYQSYQNHISFCHTETCQRVLMPREGEKLHFTKKPASPQEFKSAYMLFFDFEALQVDPDRSCSCPDHVMENTRQMEEEREELSAMSEKDRQEAELDVLMEEGERVDEWRRKVDEAEERASKRGEPLKNPPKPPVLGPKPKRVCKHKTKVLKEQPPFCYSLLLVDREGRVVESKTYVGLDSADDFVRTVLDLADKYLPSLSPGEPLDMTPEERKAALREPDYCYLCDSWLGRKDRVLDHDHLTGKLLGVAHNRCNLARREKVQLTCYAHNLAGYDSHFLVRSFHRLSTRITDLAAIPLTTQKFKAFIVNRRIRFLDSLQFLNDSLANLVETVSRSGCRFKILEQLISDAPPRSAEEDDADAGDSNRCDETGEYSLGQKKRMLRRKGVFPYSFCTSIKALDETYQIPPIRHFHNDLNDEACSVKDYDHALRVWDVFECNTMTDYAVLYVRTDVALLAEVVVAFRELIWDKFGLDMCHYFSLPHQAMDVMLKMSGAEVELMQDQEMSHMLRRAVRGGLSFVNLRYAESGEVDSATLARMKREWKGPELPKIDDHRREPDTNYCKRAYVHQKMLDANNLYGLAMTKHLPCGDYKWVDSDKLERMRADLGLYISPKGKKGYIFEVDLEYPQSLHLRHHSFPLAPETVEVKWDDLSPYSRKCAERLKYRQSYKSRKLTATFNPRRNYVVHGENLLYYVSKGLRLTKIHRAVEFTQKPFIKEYVLDCTVERIRAKTETEATLWKLMLNSVYGKFIESTWKRCDAKFDTTPAMARRHASSPLYKNTVVVGEDLTISFLRKREVKMSQCWAVGFSILELSKLHMQQLWYDTIHTFFGWNNVSLVMTDTDSFLLSIRGPYHDADEILKKLAPVMDFSNLPKGHALMNRNWAKWPGRLKDENKGEPIVRCAALKSKVHASENAKGSVVKKAVKGTTRAGQRDVRVDTLKACIDEIKAHEVMQKTLQSKNHVNRLLENRRVAFSSFDDKRYMMCGVHSCPYGSILQKYAEHNDGACYLCLRAEYYI